MRHVLTLILLMALTGCSTIGTVRKAIFGDPTIEGKDKVEYAKVIEEKEAEFRQYRETNRSLMPFQYMAILLVAGGLVLALLGQTTKDEGALAVLTGFSLSAWGFIAAKFVIVPVLVLCGYFLLMVIYIVNVSLLRKS